MPATTESSREEPPSPMAAPSPSRCAPGSTIAGYRLLSPLGAGGMGRVFLAADERLERRIALKLLPPEDADDEGRARFLREARALARVEHGNVVHVFASGIDDGVAWMALEYIEGTALSDLLGDGGLDEETALSLAGQIARGLAAVHEVGVVHRDIKPDNLLLEEDGRLRIVDFGVALFDDSAPTGGFTTRAGVAIGTPHYMAPEQARGGRVDGRADVWALGATLWALLTGRPPYFRRFDEPDMDILARVLQAPLPDVREHVEVSETTAALLSRLLEKEPARRPSDLHAVADALEEAADAVMRGDVTPARGVESAPSGPSGQATTPDETSPSAEAAPSPSDVDVQPWRASLRGRGQIGAWISASVLVTGAITMWMQGRPETVVVNSTPPQLIPEREPAGPNDIVYVAADLDPASGGARRDVMNKARPLVEPAAEGEGFGGGVVTEDAPGAAASGPSPVEAVVAAARGEGAEADAALTTLLDDDSEAGQGAVQAVVAGGDRLASRTIAAIASRRSLVHVGALEGALFGKARHLAMESVAALSSLRSTEAFELLRQASESHPDANVRQAARQASQEMFSVEE